MRRRLCQQVNPKCLAFHKGLRAAAAPENAKASLGAASLSADQSYANARLSASCGLRLRLRTSAIYRDMLPFTPCLCWTSALDAHLDVGVSARQSDSNARHCPMRADVVIALEVLALRARELSAIAVSGSLRVVSLQCRMCTTRPGSQPQRPVCRFISSTSTCRHRLVDAAGRSPVPCSGCCRRMYLSV